MSRADTTYHNYITSLSSSNDLYNAFKTIAISLMAVLEYWQEEFQFVHGDLHSQNIMITENPLKVLVIDFGRSSCILRQRRRYASNEFPFEFTKSLDPIIFLECTEQLFRPTAVPGKIKNYLRNKVAEVYEPILGAKSKANRYKTHYEDNPGYSYYKWWSLVLATPSFSETYSNSSPKTIIREIKTL